MTIQTDGRLLFDEHVTSPATPSTGNVVIYAKQDGFMYSKDDAGVETQLGGGGSGSSLTVDLTNNEGSTINKGDAVYVTGAGTVALGDANDDPGATKTIGLVDATSIANTVAGAILVGGVITGLSGLTAGAIYYLSETGTTGNTLTTTPPTTVGSWIVPIGIALSTTMLKVNILTPVQN